MRHVRCGSITATARRRPNGRTQSVADVQAWALDGQLVAELRRVGAYRQGMAIRVECYAGYRGEQEPLAFWLGERRLAVRAVIDRWFAPAQRWFRVDADDGNMYVVRQDEASGDWEIVAYRGTAA